MISSGLGGGGVARARFLDASSSGVMMSVGLAVAEGVPLAVGVLVALSLALGVAVAALVCVLATTTLPLAVFELLCSWLSLHPLSPEQASRVKAKATCRWRLVGGVFIVFPHNSSNLKWFRKSRQYTS